jgi:hypothetical protein
MTGFGITTMPNLPMDAFEKGEKAFRDEVRDLSVRSNEFIAGYKNEWCTEYAKEPEFVGDTDAAFYEWADNNGVRFQ